MRFPILLALTLAVAAPARADSVVTDHARSTLIAETDGVAPGEAVSLAFAQEVEQGWHVYWRNPGDSGLPLEFGWTLPQGASAGVIEYPAPERIEIGPLVNFGHHGSPVFLTSVTAPKDAEIGAALEIGLQATWLICADVCVPETGDFSLTLPILAKPEANPAATAIFTRARALQAEPLPGEAFFSVHGKNLRLDLPAADAKAAYFFPAAAGLSEPSARQTLERRDGRLVIEIKGGPEIGRTGQSLEGVVALASGGDEKSYALTATRRDRPIAAAGGATLAGLVLAAFIGGAFLNLMPCVFPILFVKAASLANAAFDRAAMRRHGIFYAVGVVTTFAALGGLLLALRAGGAALGWGFHLQSPAIVALSAYILFAVGLNLAGAFSIGAGLQNLGGGLLASKDGDIAAFLTGVLAVFVAAPCVGPFLTAPIGAAVVLPPLSGMAIFLAMGLGLALPFAALSFAPAARRALPRPGPWMERFRQVLAFPVFAAAGYFLWVLAAQTGGRGLALALCGLLALALAARLWEWGKHAAWGRIASALALVAALAPVALVRPAEAAAAVSETIAFDPADVAARRTAGEPVFIDFTAAWCVTCQVNKLTVLSAPKVREAFEQGGVAYVTADWTNRDPVIAEALASFGANGVPVYVYYPPHEEAVVLPQPLTERALLAALVR